MKSKHKYLEDAVKKVSIVDRDSGSIEIFSRMKAGVPTCSYHYGSSSQKIWFHRDDLAPDGDKTGMSSASVLQSRIEVVQGERRFSPHSSSNKLEVLPLGDGIEIVTSGSDKIVRAAGSCEVFLVEHE